MPNYIEHNPASAPVAGIIRRFWKSLSQDKAAAIANMLEVVEDYTGQDLSGSKVSGGAVVVLTAQDLTDIADDIAAKAAADAITHEAGMRQSAKDIIQSDLNSRGVVMRALALTIMDEINILRAEHSLAARTALQLRNAIQSKIDDKSADSM